MSNAWLNAAMDDRRAKNGARLMLFVLADRADEHGVSYYGITALLKKTNLSRAGAHLAINELKKLGLLKVEYKTGDKGVNVYRLLPTVQILDSLKSAPSKVLNGTVQILDKHRPDSVPNPSGIPQDPLSSASAKPQTAGKGKKAGKSKPAESASHADPRSSLVTAGFHEAYRAEFGAKYAHTGGKDGMALRTLLAGLSANDYPAEKIVQVAQAAMAHSKSLYAKWCKQAATLHGFCHAFNEIRAELSRGKQLNGVNGHGRANQPRAEPDTTPLAVEPALWTAFLNHPNFTHYHRLKNEPMPEIETDIPLGALES